MWRAIRLCQANSLMTQIGTPVLAAADITAKTIEALAGSRVVGDPLDQRPGHLRGQRLVEAALPIDARGAVPARTVNLSRGERP